MAKPYEIVAKAGGKKARITIEGEIGWWGTDSSAFISQVEKLLTDGIADIEVYLNTPGGSVFDANEIGNQIARFDGEKVAELGALCASAGTLIACYCDTVKASSNTQYMIHDPILRTTIEHMVDWEHNKKLYENLRNTALELYAGKTGLEVSVLSEMMEKTTWLTAKQAKEKGFVDEIMDKKGSLPDDAKNVLQQYKEKYGSIPAVLNHVLNTIDTITTNNMAEVQKPVAAATTQPSDAAVRAVVALAKLKGLSEEKIEKMAKADLDATLEFVEDYTPQVGSVDVSDSTPVQSTERLSDAIKQHVSQNPQNSQSKESPKMSFSEMSQKDSAGLKKLLLTDRKAFATLFAEEFGYTPTDTELANIAVGL